MSTTLIEEPKQTLSPEDPTNLLPRKLGRSRSLFDKEILGMATKQSFAKLNPVTLLKNPVIFVVEVGAALTTVYLVKDLFTHGGNTGFELQIALWLWFTVLFANFAEGMAEARGKAQADSLRKTKSDTLARRVMPNGETEPAASS